MLAMPKISARILLGVLLCTVFTGCIRQEIVITIHPDGSGKYKICKFPGEFEEIMMATIDAESMLDISDEDMSKEIASRSDGPVRCIEYDIIKNYQGRGKAEITTYAFDDLGEAIVVLENIVEMRPRFKYQDGKFFVFVNREKSQYDGMTSSGPQEQFYYKLTVNLPAKPSCDGNGAVNGNSVTWEFGNEEMKVYRDSKIGDQFLWASVDADAVKVDLSPRLFVKKVKRSMREKEVSYIDDFYCDIEIFKESDKLNSRFYGYVPIGELSVPFSYDDLKISSFIIDGVKKTTRLVSAEAGVFTGDAPGLPVRLKFTETNPWINSIDLLEVQIQMAKPIKTGTHSIKISDINKPVPVARFEGESPGVIAVLDIKMGSSTASYPVPSIDVVLDIDPVNIMGCYLDTNYGLRYKSMVQEWRTVDLGNSLDKKMKALKDNFAAGKETWKSNLVFRNVPADPFTLVFEIITEKSTGIETLKLEDVYVGPK